ncbi:cdc42 [Biomphalaria pfeifferi]|uniref:Cdc42 n=1 Tax=Biomphalaria pfeifferi TaxID=112525 RepID=A0AAD8BAE8_BIOPF|nr:cdc42 [Biomphalaria pfeifferi]
MQKFSVNTVQPGVKNYKCVVVGDGAVGKTSMLLRFVHGDFLTVYSPTHYDSFKVSVALGTEWTPCCLTLVDTAGQETYDRLRTLTYAETNVFILCFSVAEPDSFINVKSRWVPELREYQPKCPIILVGTQKDLRDNEDHEARNQQGLFISEKEGKRLARKIRAKVYAECSALTGDGLDNIFYQALMAATRPKRNNKLWHRVKAMLSVK